MTEPLRNHGDHDDATAVTAVQAPQWHRTFGVTGVLHAGVCHRTSTRQKSGIKMKEKKNGMAGKTKACKYHSY